MLTNPTSYDLKKISNEKRTHKIHYWSQKQVSVIPTKLEENVTEEETINSYE